MGKVLIIGGAVLVVVGLVLVLSERAGVPLGRLPGDVVYRGKNTTVYFPVVTSIVVSVVLSLIFWVVARMR